MKVDTGRLQILTVAAMLVLVSGGIAAYAQNQSSSPTSTTGAPIAASSGAPTTNSTGSSGLQMEAADTSTTFTTTITTTTTLTTTTSTTTTNYPLCTPPTAQGHPGRLILPITPITQPQAGAISFSDGRGCLASITTVGGIFSVEIALRYAKPVTQYNVVLVANGTSYTLGNMVTGQGGTGQLLNQVLLKTGTYVVSIQIFDTSSTPGQSTLVLQTGQGTIVSPPFPTPDSNTQSSTHTQSSQDDKGQSGHK
jgi:hypothetical protein